MLLEKWQRWKKHSSQTRIRFIFDVDQEVRTWWESPTRWEEKIRTRSLAEAKLEQSVMLLFVILKFKSNLSILINPYFHTYNWHLQFIQKKNSGPVSSSEAFPGFRPCLFILFVHASFIYEYVFRNGDVIRSRNSTRHGDKKPGNLRASKRQESISHRPESFWLLWYTLWSLLDALWPLWDTLWPQGLIPLELYNYEMK